MRAFLPLVGLLMVWGAQLEAITVRDDVTDAESQALGNSVIGSSVGHLTRSGDSVSAVLIDPRFVLTAAHVMGGAAQDSFTFAVGASIYHSVRYVVNPDYTGVTSGYDLAIIELDRPVTGVTPAVLYTGSAEIGVQATIVGFGLGGNGSGGGTLSGGVRRGATNTLDDGAAYLGIDTSRLLIFDFDAPGSLLESKTGGLFPTASEGMFAIGDSGGGVFGTIGGQTYLLGINSFVASDGDGISFNYGDVGGATRVSSNAAFIASVVPEPSTALLAVAGLLFLVQRRERL